MRNIKIELDCPGCGTTIIIEDTIEWGTSQREIFTCPECGKGVLSVGLHAPEDLGLTDLIDDNCQYKTY